SFPGPRAPGPWAPARRAFSLASSTAVELTSVAQTAAYGAASATASAIAPEPVPTSTTTPCRSSRWPVAQTTSPVLVSRGVMTNGLVTSSRPPNVAVVAPMSSSLYQRTVFRNSTLTQREHDLARGVVVEAVARLATDPTDLDALERAARQAGPHPPVDLHGLGARPNERPQRARRRGYHRPLVVRLLERGLVAEATDRRAHALEARLEALRGPELPGAGELAAKLHADVTERPLAAASGQRVDEQCRERLVLVGGELDRLELWHDRIGLRGAARAGPGPPGAPLVADGGQSGPHEPLQPRARHVSVQSLLLGE